MTNPSSAIHSETRTFQWFPMQTVMDCKDKFSIFLERTRSVNYNFASFCFTCIVNKRNRLDDGDRQGQLPSSFNFQIKFFPNLHSGSIYNGTNRKTKQLTCLERIGCEHVVQQGNGVGVGDFCSAELSKV